MAHVFAATIRNNDGISDREVGVDISVNGERRQLDEGTRLLDLAGEDSEGIAIARNGSVVPRKDWEATTLVAGDEIEIVRAVQGG